MTLPMTQFDREIEIRKGRVRLILNLPVLGIPIKDMEFVQTKAVNRIATNGNVIYYNPTYLDPMIVMAREIRGKDLTNENTYLKKMKELKWQLAHVSVHLSFGHLYNAAGKDRDVWDAACDVFADNLINRVYLDECKYLPEPKRNIKMHEANCCRPEYEDMNTEQLYEFFLKNPDKMPNRFGMDEHYDWNTDLQDMWSCKIQQAFDYWIFDGKNKRYKSSAEYIRHNLPEVIEEQMDAWKMMQNFTGMEFANEYKDLPDDEISGTLMRLADRAPEDFAIIAGRMVVDETLRGKILKTPAWLHATRAHGIFIL